MNLTVFKESGIWSFRLLILLLVIPFATFSADEKDPHEENITDPRSFACIDANRRESDNSGKSDSGEDSLLRTADFCGGNGELYEMSSSYALRCRRTEKISWAQL